MYENHLLQRKQNSALPSPKVLEWLQQANPMSFVFKK